MSVFSKTWLPALCLAVAGFIFVTTELMPIGLLPDIARDLDQSEARTGLLVTIYAWTVAAASLPLTLACARMDRRKLLLVLLSLFTAGQWLAAAAPNFACLLAARLLTALTHALFWSVTPPLAARVAPDGRTTQALALIAAMISLASVLGMPLGAMLGQRFSWRTTFAVIGVLSASFAVVLHRFLPAAPGAGRDLPGARPGPWRHPVLRRVYLLTVLVVAGHFTALTYLRPILEHIGGFSPRGVLWLLLLLGGGGFIGNFFISRHFDRHQRSGLLISVTLVALSLVGIQAATAAFWSAATLCLVWGAAMSASAIVFQTTVIKNAPVAPDVANSVYSALFNVGIGGGAFFGNRLFESFGLGAVNYGGAVLVGLALAAAVRRPGLKSKQTFDKQSDI